MALIHRGGYSNSLTVSIYIHICALIFKYTIYSFWAFISYSRWLLLPLFILLFRYRDVLPRVISVLDDQIKAVEGQSFRFHSSIRLTVTALNVIGSLWSELDGGFQIRPIIRASISFLRNDLPVEIQVLSLLVCPLCRKRCYILLYFFFKLYPIKNKDTTCDCF